MKYNFAQCLQWVLASEGGFTCDPVDPGGATNFGITITDYRAYCKPDATPDDVRAMKREEAESIYRTKYWDKVRGDELPSGVDYSVFDFAVNSGVRRAIKYLQRGVGVGMTGELDQNTMDAVAAANPAKLIAWLNNARLAFLQTLHIWPHFGNGWAKRVAQVRARSLRMAPASGGFFNALSALFRRKSQ